MYFNKQSLTCTGSTTYFGIKEMIELLCWDDDMDSHYFLYLLLQWNTKKISEILNDEFSESQWKYNFTFFESNPDNPPLPTQSQGTSIETFVISSYALENNPS